MVQRFSVDTGGYGFQDVTHCVPIGTDLVAYIDYAALEQRCKELEAEYATDVGRLVSDMRYIQGIVERGTGKPVDEKLPVTGQILEYVKSLEAENAELRKRLEPIEEYWQNSKSIKYVEITSAHASIKKCMEMASETDEDGKNEER